MTEVSTVYADVAAANAAYAERFGEKGDLGLFVHWHTIKDQERSVVQDVARIRDHPLVPADVAIYAFIYDVKTGRLDLAAAATQAGRGR